MSSAAVQSSSAAIQNHQYQQSPHAHDAYYAQHSPNGQSSSQGARRQSRRQGHGASNPSTPQQPQHYSPSGSNSSNMTTPRAQPLPPSTNASPAVTSHATASPNTASGGPPMAPPPRSSSHNRSHNAASDSERPSRSSDSRHTQQMAGHGSERRDDSRRKQQSSHKDSPRQASSSRSKAAPSHSRSATAVGSTPTGTTLPREESTIISRVGISDPQEDIAREQARIAESRPRPQGSDVTPVTGLGLVGSEGVDDGGRGGGRSRQEKSDRPRKETRFGEYYLGQTLGEGEFGKVKMGWKREGGVQVAIKLIRRESLGSNPSRLPKIYREIAILRELQHPNIVRLHEMVETERHIGIILEYASGGELFDYILNHRYLKDNAARRLFAQLVSGVGYLHKKGIVHRDLKLENLLLDRNRNIIITDFGFANTFDPKDELSDEIEYNLANKEFVKKMNLDSIQDSGHRRGDLMQTSCGSPCYAAPELVVSDSLYTGRKVDVWSCGVILYAMLAGYLPFDDDPANPEGDNINLLYKYIVSTPLTFPEYVTPHARDLLKRILVPDPRKRADLFEVARHSWLSEYAHVVGFITSSTTTESEIANTTVTESYDAPSLARSASVREPTKSSHVPVSPVGGLISKQGQIDGQQSAEKGKTHRDTKRRTVQVEYVAPQSSTAREQQTTSQSRSRARGENQGPVEVQRSSDRAMPPPARPSRDAQRAASESTALHTSTTTTRPSTGGSMSGSRLPSRGNSYGQPAQATVAQTNAQGRFSQPRGKQYIVSAPADQTEENQIGRPSTQRMPSHLVEDDRQERSHKRSNTVGGITEKIFGRNSGMFSGRQSMSQEHKQEKPQKSYPPTSMHSPLPNEDAPRKSTDSRRTSFSFSRKNSDKDAASNGQRSSRRFSLLPSGLSKSILGGGQKDSSAPGTSHSADHRRGSMQQPSRTRPTKPGMGFGPNTSRSASQSTTNSNGLQGMHDNNGYDRRRDSPASQLRNSSAPQPHSASAAQTHFSGSGFPTHYPGQKNREEEYYRNASTSNPAKQQHAQHTQQQQQQGFRPRYPEGFNEYDENARPNHNSRGDGKPAVLQKNRKFTDAYDNSSGQHAGSSGAARRVMDFFRKRGKARGGE